MTEVHDEPRRLVNADVIRMQHELAMAQATREAQPSVSVECSDTAKGDTSPTVKLWAPLGCDLTNLRDHAIEVAAIAVEVHKDVQSNFPRVIS